MNLFLNMFKHTKLVTIHRFYVFKLAFRAGIPFRGLVHDLSKFSFTEFFESVKYYDGKKSPISVCIAKKGYSLAWLHHKGRNKHHLEYWVDDSGGIFLPYKYMVEMICDRIAAGMVYNGKDWSINQPLDYWLNIEKGSFKAVHPATVLYIETVFGYLKDNGVSKTINRKYLRKVYDDIKLEFSL